jgi:hypothetical protein
VEGSGLCAHYLHGLLVPLPLHLAPSLSGARFICFCRLQYVHVTTARVHCSLLSMRMGRALLCRIAGLAPFDDGVGSGSHHQNHQPGLAWHVDATTILLNATSVLAIKTRTSVLPHGGLAHSAMDPRCLLSGSTLPLFARRPIAAVFFSLVLTGVAICNGCVHSNQCSAAAAAVFSGVL